MHSRVYIGKPLSCRCRVCDTTSWHRPINFDDNTQHLTNHTHRSTQHHNAISISFALSLIAEHTQYALFICRTLCAFRTDWLMVNPKHLRSPVAKICCSIARASCRILGSNLEHFWYMMVFAKYIIRCRSEQLRWIALSSHRMCGDKLVWYILWLSLWDSSVW